MQPEPITVKATVLSVLTCSGGGLLPTFIPPGDPIVEMTIGSGPEGLVVQADRAQTFLQVFLEIVQSAKLLRKRRQFLSARCREELLVSAVDQPPDLIADDNSGLAHRRCVGSPVLKNRRASVLHHPGSAGSAARDGEARFLQPIDPVSEAERARFLSAEEHPLYYRDPI